MKSKKEESFWNSKSFAHSSKRGKKAQITIFIIIGLILLISIGVAIYFYQQRVTAPIKKAVAVPEDVQQVYDYVTTCLNQIGKDGIILMGTQGGYITIPGAIEKNPNAYVSADPLGVSKTVMWYYEGEDRTPSLEHMQRDLAFYIKTNLPECVDFESFAERFDITPKGEILPVITFTDSEVIVEIKWPLDIKIQDRLVNLNEFVATFQARLKPMWELANKAMKTENENGWFENLTIDLMAANPRIPLSGMEFTCGTKKWHIQEVRDEIKLMLYYNFPYIRVKNTQFPPPLESLRTYENLKDDAEDIRKDLEADKEPDWPEDTPPDVYEMNRMMFDIGAKRTDLKAAFVYLPEWKMYANAQPNKGGVLSTAQMKGAKKYLRFLCMNQWHFAYDMIFPVKMMINDETAFNGEGYNFQFAFPVIIEDNEESRLFFGLRRFTIPDVGADFCTNPGTQKVDVRATGFEEGSPVAVELENANITYRCVTEECILGQTYSDGTGAIRLTAYLPEGCANPTIIANKEGYIPGEAHATQEMVDIQLTKLQRMKYTIMVHPYYEDVNKDNPGKATGQKWLEEQSYTKFTKTMHATVSITLRNMTYDQFKTYPASGEAFTSQQQGAYELAALENVTTDEVDFVYGDAQYDIDLMLFKGDTPVGGYHAENMTISYDEIAGNNNVIFHVIEYRPLPEQGYQQAGMFMFLYERGKYSDGTPYAQALRPTFTP
jgi:hypothetical protein